MAHPPLPRKRNGDPGSQGWSLQAYRSGGCSEYVNRKYMKEINLELVTRLREFIEDEARSCSMDLALIAPEYVFRMWGGKVPIEEIEEAMKAL